MTRANVLLLVFDCLSHHDLTRLSDNASNLTALSEDSFSFANAYSPSPESGPARASLFTGLDMAAHGVWTDGVALPDHEVTLPQRFSSSGYHTWLVGRRQLAGVSNWTTEHARPYEYAHFDWAHGSLHRSRQNAYLNWLEHTAPDQYAAIFPRQANADNTSIPAPQRAAMAALPDRL
ncbi:MAG: sulfatase-like hydrolase/transferase, partial [Pseudomonadota bacterium]